MQLPVLQSNCDACLALCCRAYSFERSEAFAINKAAGQPCPHLKNARCSIYADRAALGFSGCVNYDCLGAGQRVVAALASEMTKATSDEVLAKLPLTRRLHEQLTLLLAALKLPLGSRQLGQVRSLLEQAAGYARSTLSELTDGEVERLEFQTSQLLVRLRHNRAVAQLARAQTRHRS